MNFNDTEWRKDNNVSNNEKNHKGSHIKGRLPIQRHSIEIPSISLRSLNIALLMDQKKRRNYS